MFKWAVIGTGNIASTVASEITKSKRHQIVAVYSRTYERAAKFAERFSAKVYRSVEDCVEDKNVQAVYIATPHSAHYPLIKRCIELGKPILCEKSFTVNAQQAEALTTQAENAGVYLCEAMWTRFSPVTRKVLAWIKDGSIGQIKSFSGNFSFPICFTRPFMSNRVWLPEYAGGALLDLGVYPVSYAEMLLGKPESIKCKSTLEGGVDFNDDIVLGYKNGAECFLNCSFQKFHTYTGVIEGSQGKIVIPMFYRPMSAKLIVGGVQVDKVRREDKIFGHGYVYEFDAVAKDVLDGKKQSDFMPHSDTVEVMKILDECRRLGGLKYPDKIEKL